MPLDRDKSWKWRFDFVSASEAAFIDAGARGSNPPSNCVAVWYGYCCLAAWTLGPCIPWVGSQLPEESKGAREPLA